MFKMPSAFAPLFKELLSDFSKQATARRVMWLMLAAVLVVGHRTVSNLLRLLAFFGRFNPSTFHRVFSHRRWSPTRLARIIIAFLLQRYAPHGIVRLCGDETIDGHRGKKVYGKARHRDAVRSSHSHTVFRYGHKWIVLAMLIQLPYCRRPFALPILVALYRDKATNAREGRRHKTPVEIMCGLLALLMRWFPERKWHFAGDGGYGTHEFARFARRRCRQLVLVSKFFADANLHAPPPTVKAKANGRPRQKGRALPKPADVVRRSKAKRMKVGWYGGGQRTVEVVTGTGHWFKSGHGLVLVRWVFVRDVTGTHRDEYFFSTDDSLTPREIIELYGARWNIETTFQEMRSGLGLETTRGWCCNTVLRMAPCLFMLYTLVVLFYDMLPTRAAVRHWVRWQGKQTITFTDMLSEVRLYLWREWVFAQVPGGAAIQKLPRPARLLLDFGLAQAV